MVISISFMADSCRYVRICARVYIPGVITEIHASRRDEFAWISICDSQFTKQMSSRRNIRPRKKTSTSNRNCAVISVFICRVAMMWDTNEVQNLSRNFDFGIVRAMAHEEGEIARRERFDDVAFVNTNSVTTPTKIQCTYIKVKTQSNHRSFVILAHKAATIFHRDFSWSSILQ